MLSQQELIYQTIKNKISSIDRGVIFELGVHFGEDTERMISFFRGKHLNYFGFEPDPRNIEIVKSNKKKWENRKDVVFELIEGAISKEIGKTNLYLSDGNHPINGNRMTGANSIREPLEVLNRHGWIKFNETVQVQTFTIDDFCISRKIEKVDFIWSDIQGCEYDMIIGAKNMLPNIGMMLLEYSEVKLYKGQGSYNDIISLLGNNWEILAKTNTDVLILNKKY